MATARQIGQAGEAFVVSSLRSKGFTVFRWDEDAPGASAIEMQGRKKRLFLHVKAAVAPDKPKGLTLEEKVRIKKRAEAVKGEAWAAKVTLDATLGTADRTTWRRIL
jgi:hypothetical protein